MRLIRFKLLYGARWMLLALMVTAVTFTVAVSAQGADPLDPSFGEGGISFPGVPESTLSDLAVDGQGRVVSAGTSFFQLVAARYLSDGSLDRSFANGEGYLKTHYGPETRGNAIAVQPDGKIVVAGGTGPGLFYVARFEADGSPDLSFGDRKGRTLTPVGFRGGVRALEIHPGGRLLVAGYRFAYLGERWKALVATYRPNGTLNSRFGRSGFSALETLGKASIGFEAMQVQPDGRILLAGEVAGRVLLTRMLPNGKLDPSFREDGIAYVDADGSRACACSEGTGLALDRRGRAMVSANVSGPRKATAALIRLRSDGSLDRSFGNGGIVRRSLGSRLGAEDVAIQRDGKVVAAGYYNVPNDGEARMAVFRLHPDGRLDRSFGRKGFFTRDFGHESVANAALTLPNGRVVVGGRVNREPPPGPELHETAEPFLVRFVS